MKKYRRFIDAGLLLLGAAVLILLLMAPPATTPKLPANDIHQQFVETAVAHGKKTAEKGCGDCHNPDAIPLPDNHPAGYRCLFCHRLPTR
ncbi:MAG: cytochrome c [Syntrophotaleaceae bacterium]